MTSKKKDSSLLIKINGQEKKEFIRICEEKDTTASREMRRFVREFISAQGGSVKDDE